MRTQSQGCAHHNVIEDGRTGIDEQLAPCGCLDDTAEITGIDLLNDDGGVCAEKVSRTDRITVATRDVVPLTSE